MNNTVESKSHNLLIVKLLKAVYQHYPIGFNQLREKWPGYLQIKKIVSHKLDVECNDQKAIPNVLVDVLREKLPLLEIENQNYFDFPNYFVSFHIQSKDEQKTIQDTYIRLCISLICDYYTLYLAEEFRFKTESPDSFGRKIIDLHTIYSYNRNNSNSLESQLELIKEVIYKYFPKKEFISHSFLNSIRISQSVPYGTEESPNPHDNNYNLFELLFHFNQTSGSEKILQ